MQLVVLGMHRSGTSVITRLINMMGVYVGVEGDLWGANEENQKGFWERKDFQLLNEELLNRNDATWDKVARFDLAQVSDDHREWYREEFSKILIKLEQFRPWILKDPRQCLLFPFLKDIFETPIIIIVYRHPVEVAQSLEKRNGSPIHYGLALWERYTIDALQASEDMPRIFVSYNDLLENPYKVVSQLCKELEMLGVRDISCPNKKEVLAHVNEELHNNTHEPDAELDYLTIRQSKLYAYLLNSKLRDSMHLGTISNVAFKVLFDHDYWQQRTFDFNKTIEQLEDELAQLAQKIDTASKENSTLSTKFNKSVKSKDALKEKFEHLKLTLDTVKLERDEHHTLNQKISGQLSDLGQELLDYKARSKKQDATVKKAHTAAKKLEQKLQTTSLDRDKHTTLNKKLSGQLSELGQELEITSLERDKHNTLNKKLSKQLSTSEQELSDYQSHNKSQVSVLKQANTTIKTLEQGLQVKSEETENTINLNRLTQKRKIFFATYGLWGIWFGNCGVLCNGLMLPQ